MTTARANTDMPCEDQINTGQDAPKDSRAVPRPRVWARIRRPAEHGPKPTLPPGFDWKPWLGTWAEIGEPLSPAVVQHSKKICESDTWWMIVGPPEFVAALNRCAEDNAYFHLPFAFCRHMLEIGD